MKRIITIACMVIFALSLIGCSHKTESKGVTPTPQSEQFQVPLLAGWPVDQIPIHQDLTIMNTFFQVDGNRDYFSEGEFSNIYLVGTRTTKDHKPIMAFYEKLFDHVDFKMEGSISGTIGEYAVNVYHSEMAPKQLIYITFTLPQDQISWENRYFSDFPDGLVSVPEELSLYANMYSISDNLGGEYRYVLDYDTTMKAEEFADFYTSKYGDLESFQSPEPTRFQWEDQGYKIVIAYVEAYGRVHLHISQNVN